MADRTELTTVETVHEEGSWLFTIWDRYGNQDEVILVPCEDGVEQNSIASQRGNSADDSAEQNSTSSRPATDEGVEAWINRCTHEAQRFDTGRGVAMRDGRIICPKHGSLFDACTGYCDNGKAADTTLPPIDIAVEDGTVYLTDDEVSFAHAGAIGADEDDDDDGPASTSHLSF
ncbi:Rieske (2Fe-2S) protein [Halosolutus amylolyticus]|uniref:Rieske (2Fe-2S) protein n=1 Tax=Halosolutus amylolyticus TaxID=2932267 RepID=A0ABD5PRT8_9EURY|nr:Rieske 2Fe-2S domain-containing protein [Halosolutus amylolyticus]